jgi:hypothetical protein
MKKVLMIMVAAATVFAGCKKDNGNDDDNNGNIGIDDIDVYVVKLFHSSGDCYSGDCHDVVNVLKNGGVLYTFPVDVCTGDYEIAVSGNDVYVSIEDREKTTIWKNGKLLYTFPESVVSLLTVSGNDVYAVGGDRDSGKIWKNGEVLYTFNLDQVYNVEIERFVMIVSGNDVYVTGPVNVRDEGNSNSEPAAIYWKNGVAYRLASPALAYDIAVSGNDVYVTGAIPSPPHSLDLYYDTPRIPVYWKNGVLNTLPCPEDSGYNEIEVIGNDVYTTCERAGALYKNGQLFYKVPPNPYNAPVHSALFVFASTPALIWRLVDSNDWPDSQLYLNDQFLYDDCCSGRIAFAVRSR